MIWHPACAVVAHDPDARINARKAAMALVVVDSRWSRDVKGGKVFVTVKRVGPAVEVQYDTGRGGIWSMRDFVDRFALVEEKK